MELTEEQISWLASHFRLMETGDPKIAMPVTTYSEERVKEFAKLFTALHIRGSSICASERPLRKTLCQLPKGHGGSCQAVVFWEVEDGEEK